jgi:hypothetical protein
VLLQGRDVAVLWPQAVHSCQINSSIGSKMKMFQLFTASLLVAGGALLTWAAASVLEQHAVDKHAASAFSNDQGTADLPTDKALKDDALTALRT